MNTQQPTTEVSTDAGLDLKLDVATVRQELALIAPDSISAETTEDAELEEKARQFADALIDPDSSDFEAQDEMKAAINDMGRELQRKAGRQSKMLQQPIKDLSKHGEDGGPVANALVELKMEVEELDPNRFDFSAGWVTRMLGMIPGIGSAMKRYFSRYESAQTVIDAIIHSLEEGREQLKRDNVTLSEDQRGMRELSLKIERQVMLAQLLDQKLQYKLDREIPADSPKSRFVQEELIFPLRQRIMDLQQQLAVNQQGVISIEIIMRNNKELVRGVDRAINVTISALQVAVTVALALANQKIVLDKINALSQTTSDLIAGTAATLKTQGTAIHTQASQSMLQMDSLKSAFADITSAMDEISRFRREALPKMAESILEFDQLTAQGEATIERMEKAKQVRPTLQIDAG
jgi:uncharacterized protein YaaN involved in tellurite resistance